MKPLGQELRDLRQSMGLSLRTVARKARITAPYLSDIELGRRHPSDRVLGDLSKVLRIPVDELRNHDGPALIAEIQRLINEDPELITTLRRLLKLFPTSEDMEKIVER